MKRLVTVSVATVVVAVVFTVPAGAGFPGSNGNIAFASDRDGNFEVYSMNPDGSGQTRLTDIRPWDS
jgi:hypothetical protein